MIVLRATADNTLSFFVTIEECEEESSVMVLVSVFSLRISSLLKLPNPPEIYSFIPTCLDQSFDPVLFDFLWILFTLLKIS